MTTVAIWRLLKYSPLTSRHQLTFRSPKRYCRISRIQVHEGEHVLCVFSLDTPVTSSKSPVKVRLKFPSLFLFSLTVWNAWRWPTCEVSLFTESHNWCCLVQSCQPLLGWTLYRIHSHCCGSFSEKSGMTNQLLYCCCVVVIVVITIIVIIIIVVVIVIVIIIITTTTTTITTITITIITTIIITIIIISWKCFLNDFVSLTFALIYKLVSPLWLS